MWRRMPELPSIRQQPEACYRKARELIRFSLKRNTRRVNNIFVGPLVWRSIEGTLKPQQEEKRRQLGVEV